MKKDSLLRGAFAVITGYLAKRGVDRVVSKAILSSPQAKKAAEEIQKLEDELEERLAATEAARQRLAAKL